MAQGQIGSNLLQVGVGGVEQKQASGLAQDLSNLFGSVSKGVETYNTIGATAAKLDFSDKAKSYNEELAQWKQASVGQENNDAFFRSYDSRVSEISAEIVAESDKYKNHKDAFDTFNGLALDYSSNINMQLRPAVQESELKAIRYNYKTQSEYTLNQAKESGISLSKAEISAIADGGKAFGLETSWFADKSLSSDYSNAIERLQSNPNKFVSDFNIIKDGKFNDSAIPEIVDTMFSGYAKYGKDGTLVPTADYVTTEHLDKISGYLSTVRRAFTEEDSNNANNFFWESIYDQQEVSVSGLKSGAIEPSKYFEIRDSAVENFINNKDSMSDSQLKKGQQQVYSIQRAAATGDEINRMIHSATDRVQVKELLENGGTINVTVADPFDKNKLPIDVVSNITSEQVKNTINHTMNKYEGAVYTKDGGIDKTALANVLMLQSQYGIRSQLIDDAATNVLKVGTTPMGSKDDVLRQLDIVEVAISKNIKFDAVDSNLPARDYIRNLRLSYQRLYDSKKDGKPVTATELNDAKKTSSTTSSKVTVSSFVAKNINNTYDEITKDISFMNKRFGFGDAVAPSKDNVRTMLARWGHGNASSLSGKPNDEDFKMFMKDNMVEFEDTTWSNILPTGQVFRKNIYFPNVFNSSGVKAEPYQIKKAIEESLSQSGYNNLADDKLIINMNDYNGSTSIEISYRDSKNRMTKVLDPIPADKVFKYKERRDLSPNANVTKVGKSSYKVTKVGKSSYKVTKVK